MSEHEAGPRHGAEGASRAPDFGVEPPSEGTERPISPAQDATPREAAALGEPAAPGAGDAARETVATRETPAVRGLEAPSATETPRTIAASAAHRHWLAERPEIAIEVAPGKLRAQSRRDFLLYAAGVLATTVGAWWLLPDRVKSKLAPGTAHERLDTLAARVGLSRANRERALDRALSFDDDVAEALYSKDRKVRTYQRSDVTAIPNNYHGRTPGPEILPGWALEVSGLASGQTERLTLDRLMARLAFHEQVTRLVCVEGWSAVAWWGGIRFADFLAAFPPAPEARWVALRSAVSLDSSGRLEPYYVSIDLKTARHPQALLATHHAGAPLTLAHGAPLRLLVPMKLGLKNIKAITHIAYGAEEPADYWNEQGYSKYDGL